MRAQHLYFLLLEVFPRLRAQRIVAAAILIACIAAQFWAGPVLAIARELPTIAAQLEARRSKVALLASIPPQASVMASQPYLSHLAKRERLLSLHHTLKGLKTLSRTTYETPAPTDAVFIDYADQTTFNSSAGYYHPRMRTTDGREVPSSDRLLHEFLRQQSWSVQSRGAVALYLRGEGAADFDGAMSPAPFDDTTTLRAVQIAGDGAQLRLRLAWEFSGERQRFPWMMLVLDDGRTLHPLLKGACAPEAGAGRWSEEWTVEFPASLPAGEYALHAIFYDASKALWHRKLPPGDDTYILHRLELGRRRIAPIDSRP